MATIASIDGRQQKSQQQTYNIII